MSADSHIFIQTFSGFDLFVDNQVVYFSSKKSKELLARDSVYLIQRYTGKNGKK